MSHIRGWENGVVTVRKLDDEHLALMESIKQRADDLIVAQLVEAEYGSDEQNLLAKEIKVRLKTRAVGL